MDVFAIEKSKREGHFEIFEGRSLLWDYVMKNKITHICGDLSSKLVELKSKWHRKRDSLLHIQIEWDQIVMRRETINFSTIKVSPYPRSLLFCSKSTQATTKVKYCLYSVFAIGQL